MAGKFIILKDKSGKFKFNLTATNGDIIISSEFYLEKKAALKGITSVVKNAATAKIVDTTIEAADVKKPVKKTVTKAGAKPKAENKAALKTRGRKPKSE